MSMFIKTTADYSKEEYELKMEGEFGTIQVSNSWPAGVVLKTSRITGNIEHLIRLELTPQDARVLARMLEDAALAAEKRGQ